MQFNCDFLCTLLISQCIQNMNRILIQTSWTALHKAFYDSYMAVEPYQAFFYCYLERSLNYQHLQRMLYRLVHCWQPSTMNHRNNECHNFKTHPWLSVRSVCVYSNGTRSLSLIAMTVFTRQFSWTLRAWSFPAGWWPPRRTIVTTYCGYCYGDL